MSKKLFLGGEAQLFDNSGAPLAGGKVYFYEPGTSTPKDTYTDSSLATANTNPVVLDAYGRAAIWLSGDYKVVVKDSNDVTLYTEDNINPTTSSTATGKFNLVVNGSFEDDTDADGTPDSWTLTTYTGSTCQRVTDDQNHGAASMKFVSVGNGGGYVESESFFEVSPDTDINVEFDIKSSVVDVRNVVDVLWYDSAQSAVSTTSVYDESAANPSSWTHKSVSATPPATARYAKLRLYGCHSSDATPGTTWYDNVTVWSEHQHSSVPSHEHPATDISDSTATGRSVLTAADAAAARTAISAQQDVITTRGDIIIADATGAATRLTKGASGQVLTMGANDPAWADIPAAALDMELIASATASASSSIDFTGLSTIYFEYLLVIEGLVPATDGATLWLRTSTDNGATFNAGASDYAYVVDNRDNGAGASGTGSNAAAQLVATTVGLSNVATEEYSGRILIVNPANSGKRTRVVGLSCYTNSLSNETLTSFGGSRKTAEANDAIRLLMSSGNISSGGFRLYGLRAA